MERPKVISTFAGCGGSILGYQAAGFKDLLAVEWEKDAVATLRMNFPDLLLHTGDIRELSAQALMDKAGIQPGELDLLDGSPPCQGFSTSGVREVTDERNQLYDEFARLLETLRPKAFVVENVPGMTRGKMQAIYLEMMDRFRSCGYKAKAQILNAMWFGTPQQRKRLIVIGIRDDLGVEPSHPKPTTRPITFEESCGDLRGYGPQDRQLKPVVKWMAQVQPRAWSTDRKIWRRIKGNDADRRNLFWADWNSVPMTVLGEVSLAGIVHPDRRRYLSLAEVKRIGGFPDSFEFTDRERGIQRIGNSVPPPLMKAIASHVKEAICNGQ
jgi:DNA (cytosine-5)-methyltransferase 1